MNRAMVRHQDTLHRIYDIAEFYQSLQSMEYLGASFEEEPSSSLTIRPRKLIICTLGALNKTRKMLPSMSIRKHKIESRIL